MGMFDLSAAGVAIRTVARRSVPKRWCTFIVDLSIGKTTCEPQPAPRLSLRFAQPRLDGHPVNQLPVPIQEIVPILLIFQADEFLAFLAANRLHSFKTVAMGKAFLAKILPRLYENGSIL